MSRLRLTPLLLMLLLLVACGQSDSTTPTTVPDTATSVASTPTGAADASPTTAPAASPTDAATLEAATTPTAEGGAGAGGSTPEPTGLPAATITVPADERPAEARLIAQPLPGAFVQSPLTVSGQSDPTFEQMLIVRLLNADGSEIAKEPITIQADVGQRGDYSLETPFNVDLPTQALLQVYSESAMDGAIEHLASAFVVLIPDDMEPSEGERIENAELERLWIKSPSNGETISGGTVVLEGFGLASFEQTLQVTLTAEDGTVLGEQSIIVQSGELGRPGPFSAEIPYRISGTTTARLSVIDNSPAANDIVHLNSVIVTLEP